jgi:hypothetical protein
VHFEEKEYFVSLSGFQTSFYILTPGSLFTTPTEISGAVYQKQNFEGITGVSSNVEIPAHRSFKRTACFKISY